MADIEARREARRRKILENSERRLKKISGVEEKSTRSELDCINLSTSYENDTESPTLLSSRALEHNDIHNLQNNIPSTPLELETLFHNPRSVADDSVSNCYVEVVQPRNYRNVFILAIPIVLSFILVLFELLQIDPKSFYLDKIFVPLILYEIIMYFYDPAVGNSHNLVTSVLLLINNRNPFFTNFLGHFQYLLNIIQDLLVYFFVFTVSFWSLETIVL